MLKEDLEVNFQKGYGVLILILMEHAQRDSLFVQLVLASKS